MKKALISSLNFIEGTIDKLSPQYKVMFTGVNIVFGWCVLLAAWSINDDHTIFEQTLDPLIKMEITAGKKLSSEEINTLDCFEEVETESCLELQHYINKRMSANRTALNWFSSLLDILAVLLAIGIALKILNLTEKKLNSEKPKSSQESEE